MAGYLEDLDELILKCRNKNAREYIREAVASYRAEAYRSSIVACWVAVCYDLIEKLRELSLAGDVQASQKIDLLDKIYRDNDTGQSLKFEREILDFSKDKLELISALEYEDLSRILKDRHRCAHPSLNAEGQRYTPPAELARLHIHSAVTHLLQHEPAQGKFALDRVLSQLKSQYFPTDEAEVLKAFQSGPVQRARPSLVRNLISVLFKDLFLEKGSDYRTSLKIKASLKAICQMHRALYEEKGSEILSGIVSRVEDENLDRVAPWIHRLPQAWDFLSEVERGRLEKYVARLPAEHFGIIDDLLESPFLKKSAKQRVAFSTFEELNEMFFFFVPSEVIDRIIELYHRSKSFDEANKIASLVKSYINYFSASQVKDLLSKVHSNSQIIGSFEFSELLRKLRVLSEKGSFDLDNILRENSLDEFCESDADQIDGIPF